MQDEAMSNRPHRRPREDRQQDDGNSDALKRLYEKSNAPISLPGGPDRSGDGGRLFSAALSAPGRRGQIARVVLRGGAALILLALAAALLARLLKAAL